jgi:hypothetical protein
MGLMVNPPKPGDISYLKFSAERYILSLLIILIHVCIFKEKKTYTGIQLFSIYFLW